MLRVKRQAGGGPCNRTGNPVQHVVHKGPAGTQSGRRGNPGQRSVVQGTRTRQPRYPERKVVALKRSPVGRVTGQRQTGGT